jgi:hypothetical protein
MLLLYIQAKQLQLQLVQVPQYSRQQIYAHPLVPPVSLLKDRDMKEVRLVEKALQEEFGFLPDHAEESKFRKLFGAAAQLAGKTQKLFKRGHRQYVHHRLPAFVRILQHPPQMLWIVSQMALDRPGNSADSSKGAVTAEVMQLLGQLQSHCEVVTEVLKLLRHMVESVAHSEGYSMMGST